MEDAAYSFLFFIILMAFVATGLGLTDGLSYKEAKEAAEKIEQCELELPRNQHCVLIAVPEETKSDS